MAHFSRIDSNNKVVEVVVVGNDQEHRGQEFLAVDLGLEGTWLKTSYNTRGGKHILGGVPFRKNFGTVGSEYDPVRDAFIPPKKYPSWVLNEETCLWNPPILYPNDKKFYTWNESIQNWTLAPDDRSVPFRWSELTYSWVFMPQDGSAYRWNGETYSWDKIE